MKVTIEIDDLQQIRQIIIMLKELNVTNFHIIQDRVPEDEGEIPSDLIIKGNKEEDPSELFGMWKDNPRSIESIRQEGWQRNWN